MIVTRQMVQVLCHREARDTSLTTCANVRRVRRKGAIGKDLGRFSAQVYTRTAAAGRSIAGRGAGTADRSGPCLDTQVTGEHGTAQGSVVGRGRGHRRPLAPAVQRWAQPDWGRRWQEEQSHQDKQDVGARRWEAGQQVPCVSGSPSHGPGQQCWHHQERLRNRNCHSPHGAH